MAERSTSAVDRHPDTWLQRPDRFALEPALQLTLGAFHTPADKPMFGAIGLFWQCGAPRIKQRPLSNLD